jgi:signal peptidase II
MSPFRKKSILALVLGAALFFIDYFTKFLTQKNIPLMQGSFYPYRGIEVFKDFFGVEFSIVHATNKGAAWGLFSDFQFYLICLRILLIISLIVYLCFYNKYSSRIIPLALIAFGAFGNILDYFLYGHVIDMFHFVLWGYDFPVFNVADSMICVGIILLIFFSWYEKQDA